MADEMMIGFKRPVMIRLKHDLFGGVIVGQWHDRKAALAGPIVRTPNGAEIEVDWKRIVRFTDTDEIPWPNMEDNA